MGSESLILCQICFKTPEEASKLFLSACGHIGCFSCVGRGEFRVRCSLCNKENQRVMEINSKMSSDAATMFMPFSPQFGKFGNDFERIYKMQTQALALRSQKDKQLGTQFEKLKAYCQTEVKKKDQYKNKYLQLIEHKKKSDELVSALRLQVQKQQIALNAANLAGRKMPSKRDETMNLGNMTHDPFRTPACPRNRSFVTSTPLVRSDLGDSMADASLSFSAATGYPSKDCDNELSILTKQASAVCLGDNVTPALTRKGTVSRQISGGSGKKRSSTSANDRSENSSSVVSAFSCTQFTTTCKPSSSKNPSKKTRLELLSKTMPLPIKQ